MNERKDHWENIYSKKALTEVSWYQPKPKTSLVYIKSLRLNKDASIIDIGGGDSFLVDNLLDLGYTNITVLDISKTAIERAKKRLGERANNVDWVISDIVNFKTEKKFDLWHDRAVFHFLTKKDEIDNYLNLAKEQINKNAIIGTFSLNGPFKCSGIDITQYSIETLTELFIPEFEKIKGEKVFHLTPIETSQEFTFVVLNKI